MQERAVTALRETVPWRSGASWQVVGIEGLVLAGIGLYMLTDREGASDVVRLLIAILLLVNGLLGIASGFRAPGTQNSLYRVLRGGVAATVGMLVAMNSVIEYLEADAARTILASGLLASGSLGVVTAIMARNEGGMRITALATGAVAITLSFVLFTGDASDTSAVALLGTIALVSGGFLITYSVALYRGAARSVEAPRAAG